MSALFRLMVWVSSNWRPLQGVLSNGHPIRSHRERGHWGRKGRREVSCSTGWIGNPVLLCEEPHTRKARARGEEMGQWFLQEEALGKGTPGYGIG